MIRSCCAGHLRVLGLQGPEPFHEAVVGLVVDRQIWRLPEKGVHPEQACSLPQPAVGRGGAVRFRLQ